MLIHYLFYFSIQPHHGKVTGALVKLWLFLAFSFNLTLLIPLFRATHPYLSTSTYPTTLAKS